MNCSDTHTHWIGIAIGIAAGWFLHDLVLQLAYKLGIIEYKGVGKRDNH